MILLLFHLQNELTDGFSQITTYRQMVPVLCVSAMRSDKTA